MLRTSNNKPEDVVVWLKSLKIHDKLDIFDETLRCWSIGTIVEVELPSNQHNNGWITKQSNQNKRNALQLKKNIKPDEMNQLRYKIHYDGWASKWDEWIAINKSMCITKIDIFHIHTAYHTKNAKCRWRRTNKWIKCKNCDKKLCAECIPDIHNEEQIICCEEAIISNTLKQSILSKKMEDTIIQLISSYSIGYIANCCRDECDGEIAINTQYDLIRLPLSKRCYNIDIENVSDENRNKMIKIYDRYYRITCDQCTMYQCDYGACKNTEIEPGYCMNHGICSLCNAGLYSWSNYHQCKNCNICICGACCSESLCKNCITTQETEDVTNAIFAAIDDNIELATFLDRNIVHIITEFATGIVAVCCNQNCQNEIAVNNRFLFEVTKVDFEGNGIWHYVLKKPKSYKPDEMINVYGKSYRVFCGKCRIDTSRYCTLCSNYELERICGDHRRCSECGTKQKVVSCRKCNTYCCKKCFHHDRKVCSSCIDKMEKERMRNLLVSNIKNYFEDKIIGIICEFAVGIIVKCNGLNVECNTEIVGRSRSEFECLRIDENGKRIYYYTVRTERLCKMLEVTEVYGRKRRVFCDKCLNGKINVYHCDCCGKEDVLKEKFTVCRECKHKFCDNNLELECIDGEYHHELHGDDINETIELNEELMDYAFIKQHGFDNNLCVNRIINKKWNDNNYNNDNDNNQKLRKCMKIKRKEKKWKKKNTRRDLSLFLKKRQYLQSGF